MLNPNVIGKLLLQQGNGIASDEATSSNSIHKRRVDILLESNVLRPQIPEFHD